MFRDIQKTRPQNLIKPEEKEGSWCHFATSDLKRSTKPLGLSVFRDAFSRPSKNVKTIRKTMFCDNAKVHCENLINTVGFWSFWVPNREMMSQRQRKPLGFSLPRDVILWLSQNVENHYDYSYLEHPEKAMKTLYNLRISCSFGHNFPKFTPKWSKNHWYFH